MTIEVASERRPVCRSLARKIVGGPPMKNRYCASGCSSFLTGGTADFRLAEPRLNAFQKCYLRHRSQSSSSRSD